MLRVTEGLVPDAPPEELAVIGAVRRAAQPLGQAVDRPAVGNGHGQDEAPEVAKSPAREVAGEGLEMLEFPVGSGRW